MSISKVITSDKYAFRTENHGFFVFETPEGLRLDYVSEGGVQDSFTAYDMNVKHEISIGEILLYVEEFVMAKYPYVPDNCLLFTGVRDILENMHSRYTKKISEGVRQL
jgi:hypothetical protein